MLYIVSTPIGNLEDITFRAVAVLKKAAYIAAEDTRETKKLLDHYGISTRMISYHEHNKIARTKELIEYLKAGSDVALVADRGTPAISDPGLHLIRAAIEEHIELTALPGPTAAVTALVLSGKPTDKFLFVGFLPVKKGRRSRMLQEYLALSMTKIIYESPHRLLTLLEELTKMNSSLEVVVCRELTKKFEEIIRGTAQDVFGHFTRTKPCGEFVVII